MADFSRLNLNARLAAEEQEDELDRLMASHSADVAEESVQAAAPASDADPFAHTLKELIDDDEEEYVAPVKVTLPVVRPVVAPAVKVAEAPLPVKQAPVRNGSNLVKKGQKNPHGATNPERVTEVDARMLAHLGQFRCADEHTLSQLQLARYNPGTRTSGTKLMAEGTVVSRLKKLKRLGMVTAFKNPVNSKKLWQATDAGIAAARGFGFLERDDAVAWGGADSMGFALISHYDAISLVAALLVSPLSPYKEIVGEVSVDELISETEIRRAQKPIAQRLFEEGKSKGDKQSFGDWRAKKLAEVLDAVRRKDLDVADVLDFYPELWTLGQPKGDLPVKETHWPDLVISREDGRTTPRSQSIGVEVELTLKNTADLVAILRTIALELEAPLVYGRFVYFGPAKVEKKLRKLDAIHGFKLFESGKLTFVPLTDGAGVPVVYNARVGG